MIRLSLSTGSSQWTAAENLGPLTIKVAPKHQLASLRMCWSLVCACMRRR